MFEWFKINPTNHVVTTESVDILEKYVINAASSLPIHASQALNYADNSSKNIYDQHFNSNKRLTVLAQWYQSVFDYNNPIDSNYQSISSRRILTNIEKSSDDLMPAVRIYANLETRAPAHFMGYENALAFESKIANAFKFMKQHNMFSVAYWPYKYIDKFSNKLSLSDFIPMVTNKNWNINTQTGNFGFAKLELENMSFKNKIEENNQINTKKLTALWQPFIDSYKKYSAAVDTINKNAGGLLMYYKRPPEDFLKGIDLPKGLPLMPKILGALLAIATLGLITTKAVAPQSNHKAA